MKKQFTLVEIVIALVVLLILVTSSIISYQKVMENSRMRLSANNMLGLAAAVEVYALENDSLPATLGQLLPEHLEKGYAYARTQTDWLTRLSIWLCRMSEGSLAWAQQYPLIGTAFLIYDNLKAYGVKQEMFEVPLSSSKVPLYYAINNGFKNKIWKSISDDVLLIAEGTNSNRLIGQNGGNLATQYSGQRGLAVTKGKKILSGTKTNLESYCHIEYVTSTQ